MISDVCLVRWSPYDVKEYKKGTKEIPDGYEIVIGMSKISGWDIKKLPESEYENWIDLVDSHKWAELIALHDKYELSGYRYGCCNTDGFIKWAKYIKAWIIKKKEGR
jgi:hypothetical protein